MFKDRKFIQKYLFMTILLLETKNIIVKVFKYIKKYISQWFVNIDCKELAKYNA